MTDNRNVHSPRLPGGDLVSAVLNRNVMGLADRGGASGLVGERWANLCADWTAEWSDFQMPVPDGGAAPLVVQRVIRLDHRPEIERAASKRALQNPDLLLVGERAGQSTLQAADAKFSVETARSKQVSPEVVEAFLRLGPILQPVIGPLPDAIAIVPGVFLCPDYPLTHLMLRRRRGITRVTVSRREVVLVPVSARRFFAPIEGAPIMAPLADVDELSISIDQSLLAGLYYFRLARAAIGCWLDSVRPLLALNDTTRVEMDAIGAETATRARRSDTAWNVIQSWDADVGTIRGQRAAVEQVAGLPITGRELRDVIGRVAAGTEKPPSVNQVKRRLGAWYRQEIRSRVGPLHPPIADLPRVLQVVATASAEVAPRVDARAREIVEQLLLQPKTDDDNEFGTR